MMQLCKAAPEGFHTARRRQREAERFVSFREEYWRNDRNAYRAALAVGYSEPMARAKFYRLRRLAQAAEQLERLGFTLVAAVNSYCSAANGARREQWQISLCRRTRYWSDEKLRR